MTELFLVSDTHFGHAGVCRFTRADGSKLRPWDDPAEMDEHMVEAWNATVRPADKVYHLGDVVIGRKHLAVLDRLNGDKVLIKGNHDIFKLSDYTKYFRDIRAYHVMRGDRFILSHIPVHESQKCRFNANIHGHTHSNNVIDSNGNKDMWYYSVCVEQTDFKPVSYDKVKSRIYTNLLINKE